MLEKNYKLAEMIFLEQVWGRGGQMGGRGSGDPGKWKYLVELPEVWGEGERSFFLSPTHSLTTTHNPEPVLVIFCLEVAPD